MHWETKKVVWLALLWYSLYCSGLYPHSQYLGGEPVDTGKHHAAFQFTSVFVVYLFSCVLLFTIPWTAAHQASLSFTVSQGLLKLMSIELIMPYNHLILCHPLLLLPSIFPSIRVFSSELALCIRWPKYWSYSFSISPSNEYSELISFRIEWFDIFALWGILKSLLYHYNSKASILQHLAFFMVQLSHPYMTTGKTIALNIWTLVNKVMSLISW